ncbi:MAG TPA: asparagine synthase (glutamine-hydrolyzing) [Ignavibacteria bacterium]|nr:asparagine synthase (glutamine-hydrolyzing) [Ignavibacteria bacterium]
MCGISGEYIIKGRLTEKAEFIRLNDLAVKRGPDSSGHWSDNENCQLGFSRLAILDLSVNGNQPMISPSGRLAMVYNGEIYNFADIKKKLPADKYTFKGHSDTEIILCAFEHFGIEETVKMLDGMFAIGIYDRNKKELNLIRDFAGIKPLYFGFDNKRVFFASQYDQIFLQEDFRSSEIDQSVLKLYLRQHYIPSPFGILKNTYQAEPGQIITFNSNGLTGKKKYWEFPGRKDNISIESEALDYIDHELDRSVHSELASDVPLGSFLSGGIDSPLITYYARKNTSGILKCFTIGSDSKMHDESEDAEYYAKKIGVDLDIKKMDSNIALGILDEVMDTLKEPFADFSIIPTYLLCKSARRKVTVALSGDGGDELFFGYERFWSILKNFSYLKIPQTLRYPAFGVDKLLFKNKHINSNLLFKKLSDSHFELHSRFNENEIVTIFPEMAMKNIPETYSEYNYEDKGSAENMLWEIQKSEFYGMMQKTLVKVDRASMGNSLEVRVPFLKKAFIEASMNISPALSFDKVHKKEILKKLLNKKVGRDKITNIKRGFTIPLAKWIREDLRTTFYETLLSNNFKETFNLNKDNLEGLLNIHMSGRRDAKWPLFTLYSLAKWNEKRNLSIKSI